MEENNFDLIVIGSGPAGYIAAIRAAQLGMKVACIEKGQALGGTCLNVGCIPSKTLLDTSKKYEDALNHLPKIGISTTANLDLKTVLSNKDKVVADLVKGIEGLFTKNKVTKVTGVAKFISHNQVEVTQGDAKRLITGKKILIATGSDVMPLKGVEIDEKRILSSTGGLNINEVPKKLFVIGGGYIGLEMGSVWRRFGSEVTIVEYADSIIPQADKEISKRFKQILEKQGMKFILSSKVINATSKEDSVELSLESVDGKAIEKITCDYVLVAVGRRPHTSSLGLEVIGIKLDSTGRITVDHEFQTNVPGVYAVGDVIAGPMLAHKAEDEAVAAVEMMNGIKGHVNYDNIPGVVYTSPEVAFVGKTEEQLKSLNVSYKVGKFPFIANSRARTVGETEGFVKILSDSNTDRILGAHIIGCEAGNLIAELVVAMEFYASGEDIARICHAHPTLNEAIKEAALDLEKRSLNI